MELTPEKLMHLKRVVRARYDQAQADLSRLLADKAKLEQQLQEARQRSAVQIDAEATPQSSDIVAARNWASSRDVIERRARQQLSEIDGEIRTARDKTRHAHGQLEASGKLDERLAAEIARKQARIEDQSSGTFADRNGRPERR